MIRINTFNFPSQMQWKFLLYGKSVNVEKHHPWKSTITSSFIHNHSELSNVQHPWDPSIALRKLHMQFSQWQPKLPCFYHNSLTMWQHNSSSKVTAFSIVLECRVRTPHITPSQLLVIFNNLVRMWQDNSRRKARLFAKTLSLQFIQSIPWIEVTMQTTTAAVLRFRQSSHLHIIIL